MTRAVVVFSGGLDSTTALYNTIKWRGYDPICVSFNYGQRHKKELKHAADICHYLKVSHKIIDLTSLTPHIATSALTGDIEVPEGHYAEESMKLTVVPNRNMIMYSIAAGIAVSEKAECIVTGVHAGDHAVYPDCRPEFIQAVETTIQFACQGFIDDNFWIDAPFLYLSKKDIVVQGNDLEVPYSMTWSCYKGGDLHCGKCGTCVERIEAFREAGIPDPTQYQHGLGEFN